VQAFVNTHFDLERNRGADRLATVPATVEWLCERGLLASGATVDEAERRRAVAIREGLRALLAEHAGARARPAAVAGLRAAADGLHSAVAVGADGRTTAAAASDDLAGALGLTLALIGEAQAAGTWTRLKACPGEHCGWAFFDTVINTWLITEGGLDIHTGDVIGLCAESHCEFKAALVFPETVDAGLRVQRLGRSSVRYELALFAEGSDTPAATGWFVHVFVDRASRRATEIPPDLRAALERLRP